MKQNGEEREKETERDREKETDREKNVLHKTQIGKPLTANERKAYL